MIKANEQILEDLANKLANASAILEKETKEVNRLDTLAKEYQRQIEYHVQRGDNVNAEQVAPLLNNTYSFLLTAKKVRDVAKQDYDAALIAYTDAKNSILTPAELKEIEITANSNAAIAQAEAAVKGAQAKSEAEVKAAEAKTNYAAKTTQYVLITVVVLVVIVVVTFFVIKSKKKTATT
jgi:hypothetical protein